MEKIVSMVILVLSAGTVCGQINLKHKENKNMLSRMARFETFGKTTTPAYNLLPANGSISTSQGYWSGSSYRTVSDDGRFQSEHMFDTMGNLRESRASFRLRKAGNLSSWRIQISPQRNRPWLSYVIH